jgi:coiled-coil and C2 domain-containing protein 2A
MPVTAAAASAAAAAAAAAAKSNVAAGGETLMEGGVLPERERRFLGCIRLSLAALYQAEVMDGVFKVS